MIPGNSASLAGKYEWNFVSEPIPSLKDNGSFVLPSPKCVGGDSAINSMSYDRGTRQDYDAWEAMGNPGWGWDGLAPFFKKAVTFYPPTREQQRDFGISYDPTAHGFSGPVKVKFAKFIYPQYRSFSPSLSLPLLPERRPAKMPKQARLRTLGRRWACPSPKTPTPAMVSVRSGSRRPSTRVTSRAPTPAPPTTIPPPSVQTITCCTTLRSPAFSLTAISAQSVSWYPSPLPSPLALFAANKRAKQYAQDAKDKPKKALASREVVLTAGAYHNPKLLQLSGIGPAALLRAHKIPVVADLPGVGSNLQDHPLVRPMNYTSDPHPKGIPYIDPTPSLTNATWQAEALAEYRAHHTGYYTRPLAGSTVAFLPLPIIAPKTYKDILAAAKHVPGETDGMHHDVARGFARQKEILLTGLATKGLAAGEVSLRPGIAPGPALIIHKPLSRGKVEIASSDPWTNPKIFYGTLSHPNDVRIMTAQIRYARSFFASPGMKAFGTVETYPGKDVVSEEDLAAVARGRIVNPSVGHASGTCPMMKRSEGGVVDAELNVYGVKGLRVVDISISPIIPACHLVSTRYAVAEKGADIIRKAHK